MTPDTRYTRAGDAHIAYQVLGDGPIDIVLVDQWFSHLEAQWDVAPVATLRRRLARFSRLIMYDKQGAGLSDPVATSQLPTLETWVDEIVAVLDAVDSSKSIVVANIGAGLIGAAFAAAHPERTAGLVLVDCFARFLAAPDFPIGQSREALEAAVQDVDQGVGRGQMIDLFAPSMADDEGLRRAWSRYERQQASPGVTKAIVRLIYETDVRDVLPVIGVPTLVIHRAEAQVFPIAHGRYLADHIPGARLVELPGNDQLIWAGDQAEIAAEIQAFATGSRPTAEPSRILATMLFTDIVDSTARAAEIGDSRWRSVIEEHDLLARHEVERGGGRLVKSTGDGILATFDGPARAIRTAAAIRDAVGATGLSIRSGLHTGEIELVESDVAGISVHVGSRVAALAKGGEILVSSTVRDLVAGSGITFEDRGQYELKGISEPWRIYAVTDT